MSLAVAIFGHPRKVTEQTHPPQLNGPMAMLPGPKWLSLRPASFEGGRAAQYDQSPGLGQQACEECTPQKGQLADQALPRATTSASSAGWSSPKRQRSPTRYETKKQPRKALQVSQQLALTPTQPAGPPPDQLLRAEQRAGAGRELIGPSLARPPTPAAAQGRPTRANKILRWLGYALLHGYQALGIDVVDGWAHLHQLAKAAASDRRDLEGLTPGALRRVIEQDTSGRWILVGDQVSKVPRHARRDALPAALVDDHPGMGPPPTGRPPYRRTTTNPIPRNGCCSVPPCVVTVCIPLRPSGEVFVTGHRTAATGVRQAPLRGIGRVFLELEGTPEGSQSISGRAAGHKAVIQTMWV